MSTARERYLAFRAAQGRPPQLQRHTVRVRGLDVAVWTSPGVPGRRTGAAPGAGTSDAEPSNAGAPNASRPNAAADPGVDGPVPLCCVNGGLLFDHRVLWPTLAPLAAGRPLVFYDQRGRGASAAPPGVRAARIEHDAGDLAALRAAVAPLLGRAPDAPWDVLGHSWGGGIAMLAAADPAAGVRRLVLVDPVGVTAEWLPTLHARALAHLAAHGAAAAHAELAALDPAELATPDPAVHAAYARAFYPAWFADPALARLFVPPRAASVTGSTIAARLRREGYDWRPALRALRAPTLVVHGSADVLDASVARATVAWLGGHAPVALALLDGAGHMPFWEAPVPFFAAVESFLERPILASSPSSPDDDPAS